MVNGIGYENGDIMAIWVAITNGIGIVHALHDCKGGRQLKKRVALIAGTESTRTYLEKQLYEYISSVADIKSYSIEKGFSGFEHADLLVLSSDMMREQLEGSVILGGARELVVARRTINYDFVDKIVLIPKGTDVIFVNDSKMTARESIQTLKRLGIDHINYVEHYPGISCVPSGIDICITVGEMGKVPPGMKKVYDIGTRIIDFPTIAEILSKLDALDERAEKFSDKYLIKLINVAKRLAKSTQEIAKLYEGLNVVIDGFNEGILVYDQNGCISVLNENLKKILGISGVGSVIGRQLKYVIRGKGLMEFLMSDEMEKTRILDADGFEVVVKKVLIEKNNSFIAIFKGARQTIEENERIKRELVNKGFYAKYKFDDIVGSSLQINKTKQICKRLAKSDLTILVEGESGTGKELFASAVHNASERRKGPFLAVNFSDLPDELIESELFGYEEGAFTGAAKGGKAGIFEQSDGGTIFLDEIGDVSLKMQARLLRVLQEKEVMRIGGRQIKPVDVRVIAATNKNLDEMMKMKIFREDLYYRLKIGYVQIPPLRNRKDDIKELVEHFINIETPEKVTMHEGVIKSLVEHEWRGNVRELKNSISYMMAVRSGRLITREDMPENLICKEIADEECLRANKRSLNEYSHMQGFSRDEIEILNEIFSLREGGSIAGRDKISKNLAGRGVGLTSCQVRHRLEKLEKMGMVIKSRGKKGTVLTVEGEKFLKGLQTANPI